MLYIPKNADLANLSIPGSIYQLVVAELFQALTEREIAQAEAREAKQHEATLTEQVGIETRRANAAEARANDLAAQLEAALKPKPPVTVPPVITRKDVWPGEPAFDVTRIIGATIENSMAEPSSTQYTAVKRAADALQSMGLTTVRFYLGPAEVFGHIEPKTHMFGKLGNLVDYVREKHMHFIADGFDRVMALLGDEKLKLHVDGLNLLRTWAVCWNDADKESADKLKADVKRLREAGWAGPILFSLRADADLSLYDIEGVYLEIQTFVSDKEFEHYFEKYVNSDADLLCLDLREEQTDKQIKRQFDVALQSGKQRGYFFYTSKTRDWVATPANEVDVIRAFTTKQRAIAG